LNLAQIHYLIQVIKCGSIKKAAEVLHIKRTTLLMSLNALENELNQNILIRQKDGTTLAAESADLFAIIQKMQESINQIEMLRQEWNLKKTIRIFSTSPVLLSLIEKVNNTFPVLQQTEKPTIQINTDLSMENDFIFTLESYTNTPEHYCQYQLFDSSYCICLRNSHPLAQKELIDLASEDIHYPVISLSDAPLQNYNYQSINNFSSLQRIISTSDCLALIPEIFLKHINAPFISLITPIQILNFNLRFKAFLLAHSEIAGHSIAASYLNYILSIFEE